MLLAGGAIALSGLWATGTFGQSALAAAKRPSYRAKLSDAQLADLFERAQQELKATTAFHIGSWHMDTATWAVDLDIGRISFVTKTGTNVHAPVQVIGTRLKSDRTWLWAWDNPSIPSACAADARRVRAFGTRQGIAALTDAKIDASEADAWKYTALAAHLAAANGAYRGVAGKTEVFMTFGMVTMEGASGAPAPE